MRQAFIFFVFVIFVQASIVIPTFFSMDKMLLDSTVIDCDVVARFILSKQFSHTQHPEEFVLVAQALYELSSNYIEAAPDIKSKCAAILCPSLCRILESQAWRNGLPIELLVEEMIRDSASLFGHGFYPADLFLKMYLMDAALRAILLYRVYTLDSRLYQDVCGWACSCYAEWYSFYKPCVIDLARHQSCGLRDILNNNRRYLGGLLQRHGVKLETDSLVGEYYS